MNICVIGAGRVGLVNAVVLAGQGHNILCIDIDSEKVNTISQGKSSIYEDGLDELLLSCVKQRHNLAASTNYDETLDYDITLICVNTPSNSHGDIDLSHIMDSAREIGKVLEKRKDYHVVVVRSTVLPGTTEKVIIPILERYSGKQAGEDFGIAANPEFLQAGNALDCFLNPDRIIIGEYDRRSGDTVAEIYRDCTAPILRMDLSTAEMIKYASNAFLATKISFINEIGNICKKLGVDVYTVAQGMAFDPRIGSLFLSAGVGFGGSCLPKDLKALIHQAQAVGYIPRLLQSVIEVNKVQPSRMVEMAREKLGDLKNKRLAVLGLAFKPNTEDVRDSPALEIVNLLLQQGAGIRTYDPVAMRDGYRMSPNGVEYCASAVEAISDSDCVLIITDWDEFKDETLYSGKIVIDGRRTLDPEKARGACRYEGICW